MTYLCVPTCASSLEQGKRDAILAAETGADLTESRIDSSTADPDALQNLLASCRLPAIATCRATWEGGHSEFAESSRADRLNQVVETDAAYLDIELAATNSTKLDPRDAAAFAAILNIPRDTRPGIILSSHDFGCRPDRLYNILAEMNASVADVNKIVWTARTVRDNIEAFEILLSRQKPTVALCMGEAGIISRILAKKFGAFLTFASLSAGAETAPGQVTIDDMKRLYRWDAMNANTRVYGVVGAPVMHSMSPALHNPAFEQVGFDGVYVPLLVNEGYESFKAFMETFLAFEPLHLSGLSVTIPHKENALRYLKEKGGEVDALAESIGAINTIVVQGDLKSQISNLRGFSTDYAAILDSITSALAISREQLSNYRVAVLGAGGTGRTAVAALAHYGATVVVYNRTFERAAALAVEFNGHSGKVVGARMEKLCDSCCEIFINTTSVGMHPMVDASPIDGLGVTFDSKTLVFDAIYNPMRTRLLQIAEAAGAKTIGGGEMVVRQGAGQVEAWTSKKAPPDLMLRVGGGRF